MKEVKLSSNKVYNCSFLDIYEDEVLLPNNNTSKRIYIDHIGGACVLPITKDKKIILTKQFRYPINDVSIEVPAGKKDSKNETGLEVVKRELEEETGYQSNKFIAVSSYFPAVGYSNELLESFIALDCYKVENPKPADEDEFIEVLELSLKEAKAMINSKVIKDVKTILAILQYEGSLYD